MYFDFIVKIPEMKRVTRKGTYVEYAYERHYDAEKKATITKRTTIGKISKVDTEKMHPNENYYKFFADEQLPTASAESKRSSCLRIGTYIVIKKIIEDYGLHKYLGNGFDEKDIGLLLDIAAYTITMENNAGQYYPDYAYNHPLFTENMTMYSDSKVSSFLNSITCDHSADFLNSWNKDRYHREKIYISYDSTNKNSQAGDVDLVEYGKAKVDTGAPIFNYAVGYDLKNQEPLFYQDYPGSINDVSQLRFMLEAAKGFGYKNIGFVLDRGYFSKQNFELLDSNGYSFIIMMKGKKQLVSEMIRKYRGSFEEKRVNCIRDFGVYGITIKQKLYDTDERERYFHLYHSIDREADEKNDLERRLRKMAEFLKKHRNQDREFGKDYEKYFDLQYDEEDHKFLMGIEQYKVIEDEMKLCGYFCIITSENMTAKDALYLYKSRDSSEKLFRGDKSYLGNKSMRTHKNESTEAKIFIEFIALIIRSRMYVQIHEALLKMDTRPNYMNVAAAIKELEKIEMIRRTDGVYRLDHAVTAVQKKILGAFGLTAQNVLYRADEISKQLKTIRDKEK